MATVRDNTPMDPSDHNYAIVFLLDDRFEEFRKGYQFKIETFDGDEFFARDEQQMEILRSRLGVESCTVKDMEARREARLQRQRQKKQS